MVAVGCISAVRQQGLGEGGRQRGCRYSYADTEIPGDEPKGKGLPESRDLQGRMRVKIDVEKNGCENRRPRMINSSA